MISVDVDQYTVLIRATAWAKEQRLADEVRNLEESYHAKMQLSSGSVNK
jgi:hypothetical protein